MTKGEIDYAIRQALNVLDDWNDVVEVVPKGSGYYYEMQKVIEDAVLIGAKVACEGIKVDLSEIIED